MAGLKATYGGDAKEIVVTKVFATLFHLVQNPKADYLSDNHTWFLTSDYKNQVPTIILVTLVSFLISS